MASSTLFGAGTLGLPILKSKTFSAPISAFLLLPYSKISLISERTFPNFTNDSVYILSSLFITSAYES